MKKKFKLMLNPLDLADKDHIATDWEVSTTKNFSDVICSSYMDRTFKKSKSFIYDVMPGKKYWGRARVYYNTGVSEWSNFDLTVPKTIKDIPGLEFLPSNIASPCLYTDSTVDHHIPIGFTMKTKDFSCHGDGYHVATSWYIEKLTGEIVWKRERDEINKYQYFVSDVFLTPNTMYRLKAIYHSSSNDVSVPSTYTICVGEKSQDVNILRITDGLEHINFESEHDIVIELVKHDGVTDVELEVHQYTDTSSQLAYSNKYTLVNRNTKITIPSTNFLRNQIYVVYLKYNNKEERIYNTFNTFYGEPTNINYRDPMIPDHMEPMDYEHEHIHV